VRCHAGGLQSDGLRGGRSVLSTFLRERIANRFRLLAECAEDEHTLGGPRFIGSHKTLRSECLAAFKPAADQEIGARNKGRLPAEFLVLVRNRLLLAGPAGTVLSRLDDQFGLAKPNLRSECDANLVLVAEAGCCDDLKLSILENALG